MKKMKKNVNVFLSTLLLGHLLQVPVNAIQNDSKDTELDIHDEDVEDEDLAENDKKFEEKETELEEMTAEAQVWDVEKLQVGTPEFDAILERWGEFWTGEYETHADGSMTLFFSASHADHVPHVVRNNPERFNLRRIQTDIKVEISTELITHGSLEADDFHDPFGAPAGAPYTRTVYSYEFDGNDPLPASLIGQEYENIYQAGGYITRMIGGVEKRFSLVNAGNHSYLDNLVDPSNNGTASWHSAPGDGVYTLSGWVGRTGAGGGAHFRVAEGGYVNLDLLLDVAIGSEILVYTTIERYNQWVFNPAQRITKETEDGLVWMRLVRVAPAPGAGQQNNPRFNWQKFVISTDVVFNAVTYSWSVVDVITEIPVYTYFWEKRIEIEEQPTIATEPTEPATEWSYPTESTAPMTEPSEPTELTEPTTESTVPAESTAPTTEPSEPTKPTAPTMEPSEPTETTTPMTEPSEPTELTEPTMESSYPTESTAPATESSYPTESTTPTTEPIPTVPEDGDTEDENVGGMMPEVNPTRPAPWNPQQPNLPQMGMAKPSAKFLGSIALSLAGLIASLKKKRDQ